MGETASIKKVRKRTGAGQEKHGKRRLRCLCFCASGGRLFFLHGSQPFRYSSSAARLKLPLAEWDEPLHIVPAVHKTDAPLDLPGTYVLMKSASHMAEVKKLLRDSGRDVAAVENCGMENERIYRSADEIPDDAGYFSLIIAKERHD